MHTSIIFSLLVRADFFANFVMRGKRRGKNSSIIFSIDEHFPFAQTVLPQLCDMVCARKRSQTATEDDQVGRRVGGILKENGAPHGHPACQTATEDDQAG